jgi:hypothetical protein
MSCFKPLSETDMQTTREASYAPEREAGTPPTLLPACCVCGLVRDDIRLSSDYELWVTQRTYHETHGINPAELALTHTYCPKCSAKVRDTVRQHFRDIGTPS